MANTDQASEPTMEEILASIRRIISDDDKEAETAGEATEGAEQVAEASEADEADAAPQGEDAAEEPPSADVMSETAPEAAAEVDFDAAAEATAAEATAEPVDAPANDAAAGEDEDIFDLTDVVAGGDATVPPEAPVDLDAVAEAEQAADEAVAGNGEDVQPQPLDEVDFSGDDDIEFVDAGAMDETMAEPDSMQFEATPEPDPAPGPQTDYAPLLSGEGNATTAAAFQALTETLIAQRGGARTMEDLVQDLFRPMLKSWLDQNLPELAERLVREEIERVVRRGGR